MTHLNIWHNHAAQYVRAKTCYIDKAKCWWLKVKYFVCLCCSFWNGAKTWHTLQKLASTYLNTQRVFNLLIKWLVDCFPKLPWLPSTPLDFKPNFHITNFLNKDNPRLLLYLMQYSNSSFLKGINKEFLHSCQELFRFSKVRFMKKSLLLLLEGWKDHL